MRDYNFFEQYYKKKKIEINPKSSGFIAVVLVIIFVALTIGLFARNLILGMDIASLYQERETKVASKEYIEANRLKQSIDAMKEYDAAAEEILQKFQEANLLGTEVLKILTGAIPTAVTMNSVTMDNATATFEFGAPNRKAAAELLLNLKECGLFQEVTLGSASSDPNSGQVSVSINAVMKAGEEK